MPTGTPLNWAGQSLTAALANAEFRDQFVALYGAPVGRLWRDASSINIADQSAASVLTTVASGNLMTFNKATANAYTGAMTTGSTPWSRLTAPIAGIYEANGLMAWATGGGASSPVVTALLRMNTTIVDAEAKNGSIAASDIAGPSGSLYDRTCPRAGTELRMNAGDYVELYGTVYYGPGGSLWDVGAISYLTLTWVGNLA